MKTTSVTFLLLLLGYEFTGFTHAQVTVEPARQVIRTGEAFQFVCRIGQPIETCRIKGPLSTPQDIIYSVKSTFPELPGIEYFGNGLSAGDCGIRLQKSDFIPDSALFKCSIFLPHSITEILGQSTLIIAKPPSLPELSFNKKDYKYGEEIQAKCIVKNGVPPANISWFLGEEMVKSGLQEPELLIENSLKPYMQTVSQNLNRTLGWTDHGKKLRCVAQHMSLDRDLSVEKELQVKFPPQGHQSTLEQTGVEEGSEGWITVVVASNPRPILQWRINGINITNLTGLYEPFKAQQVLQDPGRWEAILRIKNVTAVDFNNEFMLTATNELGSQNYTVKIYTSSTNATMIGVITGLVSFLLVIIIASLVLVCRCNSPSRRHGSTKQDNNTSHPSDNDGYLSPRPRSESPIYDVLNFNDEGEDENNHSYEYVTSPPRERINAPPFQSKQFNDPIPLYRDVPLPPSGPMSIPFIDAPNLPSGREEYVYVPPERPSILTNGFKPLQFKFNDDDNDNDNGGITKNYQNVSTAV